MEETSVDKEKFEIQKISFKKTSVIFLSIFIILILLFLVYNYRAEKLWNEHKGDFEYFAKVGTNESGEYIVLIPCVIDRDGNLTQELMDDLSIQGNGTVTPIISHGSYMLKISGNGWFTISSQFAYDTHDGDNLRRGFSPGLTSIDPDKNDHWSNRFQYCPVNLTDESSISEIHIDVRIHERTSGYFYNGLGQGGWNWGFSGDSNCSGLINKSSTQIDSHFEGVHGDAFVGWDFFPPASIFIIAGISLLISGNISLLILNRNLLEDKKYNNKKIYLASHWIIIGSYPLILLELLFHLNTTYYHGDNPIIEFFHIGYWDKWASLTVILVLLGSFSLYNLGPFRSNNIRTVLHNSESDKKSNTAFWWSIASIISLLIYALLYLSIICDYYGNGYILYFLTYGMFIFWWFIAIIIVIISLITSIYVKVKIRRGVFQKNKKSSLAFIISLICTIAFILFQFGIPIISYVL